MEQVSAAHAAAARLPLKNSFTFNITEADIGGIQLVVVATGKGTGLPLSFFFSLSFFH